MQQLNLMAPINTLGYGVVGTNLLKYLSQQLDVALFPIGNVDITRSEDVPIIQNAIDIANQFEGLTNAPSLKVWHEFALADRIGNGPSFAFPFFEINKFDHSNQFGHINVPIKKLEEFIKELQQDIKSLERRKRDK